MLQESIILAQKSNAKVKGGVKGKARFASFGERFLRALSYLKVSKNISRRIVYAGRWIPLADNPAEVFKSVGINSNVNRKKAAHIAAGKAVAAKEEAEAEAEEEEETEDEEPIEATDDTITSAPKRPAQDSCDQAVEKKRRAKR